MHSTMGVAVRKSKQTSGLSLLPEQIRSDERRLTATFVGMAGALRSRPEPRAKWDNVAAHRAHYKGRDAVLAGQEVMRDAIATGNIDTIDRTAERVGLHFDRMKTVALRAYYAITSGRITLAAARVKASKETSEALHSIVQSTVSGNDGCELTIKEIDEAIEALSNLRSGMVAAQAPTPQRPTLVVS
jgi:flagellin-like hook-associated protein FlgL